MKDLKPGGSTLTSALASDEVATPGRSTLTQSPVTPVQMKIGATSGVPSSDEVHAAAQRGASGAGGALPFLELIQRSFGRHDVSGIRAHTGAAAAEGARGMGAEAYASGTNVAFGGAPDLHTAAHEAAHIVQQRAGLALAGGVGAAGDVHEQHADEVADRVVAGESAEDLLDRYAGGATSSPSAGLVQQKIKSTSTGVQYATWHKIQQSPAKAAADAVKAAVAAALGAELVNARFVTVWNRVAKEGDAATAFDVDASAPLIAELVKRYNASADAADKFADRQEDIDELVDPLLQDQQDLKKQLGGRNTMLVRTPMHKFPAAKPKTPAERAQRGQTHLSTVTHNYYGGTGEESQASFARDKSGVIHATNRNSVNDQLRADAPDVAGLQGLAARVAVDRGLPTMSRREAMDDRVVRHAMKCFRRLTEYLNASGTVTVPGSVVAAENGLHAEIRIEKSAEFDVATHHMPTGTKVPCAGCFLFFIDNGYDVGIYMGPMWLTNPALSTQLGRHRIGTLGDDVAVLSKKIKDQYVKALAKGGLMGESLTKAGAHTHDHNADSESELSDNEFEAAMKAIIKRASATAAAGSGPTSTRGRGAKAAGRGAKAAGRGTTAGPGTKTPKPAILPPAAPSGTPLPSSLLGLPLLPAPPFAPLMMHGASPQPISSYAPLLFGGASTMHGAPPPPPTSSHAPPLLGGTSTMHGASPPPPALSHAPPVVGGPSLHGPAAPSSGNTLAPTGSAPPQLPVSGPSASGPPTLSSSAMQQFASLMRPAPQPDWAMRAGLQQNFVETVRPSGIGNVANLNNASGVANNCLIHSIADALRIPVVELQLRLIRAAVGGDADRFLGPADVPAILRTLGVDARVVIIETYGVTGNDGSAAYRAAIHGGAGQTIYVVNAHDLHFGWCTPKPGYKVVLGNGTATFVREDTVAASPLSPSPFASSGHGGSSGGPPRDVGTPAGGLLSLGARGASFPSGGRGGPSGADVPHAPSFVATSGGAPFSFAPSDRGAPLRSLSLLSTSSVMNGVVPSSYDFSARGGGRSAPLRSSATVVPQWQPIAAAAASTSVSQPKRALDDDDEPAVIDDNDLGPRQQSAKRPAPSSALRPELSRATTDLATRPPKLFRGPSLDGAPSSRGGRGGRLDPSWERRVASPPSAKRQRRRADEKDESSSEHLFDDFLDEDPSTKHQDEGDTF